MLSPPTRLPYPLPLLLLVLHTTVLLSCLPLLLGILLPRPLLLLPWLFSSSTTTTVELSSDIFLAHLTPLANQPVTAFVFTLTFFLLCLQVVTTKRTTPQLYLQVYTISCITSLYIAPSNLCPAPSPPPRPPTLLRPSLSAIQEEEDQQPTAM